MYTSFNEWTARKHQHIRWKALVARTDNKLPLDTLDGAKNVVEVFYPTVINNRAINGNREDQDRILGDARRIPKVKSRKTTQNHREQWRIIVATVVTEVLDR
jgi:hypothetical protein